MHEKIFNNPQCSNTIKWPCPNNIEHLILHCSSHIVHIILIIYLYLPNFYNPQFKKSCLRYITAQCTFKYNNKTQYCIKCWATKSHRLNSITSLGIHDWAVFSFPSASANLWGLLDTTLFFANICYMVCFWSNFFANMEWTGLSGSVGSASDSYSVGPWIKAWLV